MSFTSQDEVTHRTLPVNFNEAISVTTIVAYLFGSRTAILKLAANRGTIWLGLLLVISAGFAREYDGEDLLHKPSHLLLPLIASLATSMLLFGLIYLLSLRRHANLGSVLGAYLVFLSLYWMTAPLAWFYAIPFERFMTAGGAVSMNLNLLGLVSIWRVCLITRVITVIFNARVETVIPVVLLFADTVALFLASYVPVPIMAFMGGIRLTESERIISNRTLEVFFLGTFTYPIWLLSTCVVFSVSKPSWSWMVTDRQSVDQIRRSVWVVAAVMNLGWIVVLPITQREQQLRFQAEQLLRESRFADAINLMSAHQRQEFPPHWDPLPHSLLRNELSSIVKLMAAVVGRENDWIRPLIFEKFQSAFPERSFWSQFRILESSDRLEFLNVLEQMILRGEVLFPQDLPSHPNNFFPENMDSMQHGQMETIAPSVGQIIPAEPRRTRLEEGLRDLLDIPLHSPTEDQISSKVRDKIDHLIHLLQSARSGQSSDK